jgi:hypothetical protein
MAKIGEGKYPTVEVTNIPLNEGQTTSNKNLLQRAFSESPLFTGYNVEALIELAADVLNPKGPDNAIEGNFQFINQSLDYGVNIGDDTVELSSAEKPSLPSSKFTPNLSSPGAGKTTPEEMKQFVLTPEDITRYANGNVPEESAGTQRPVNNNTKITVGSLLNLGTSKGQGQ